MFSERFFKLLRFDTSFVKIDWQMTKLWLVCYRIKTWNFLALFGVYFRENISLLLSFYTVHNPCQHDNHFHYGRDRCCALVGGGQLCGPYRQHSCSPYWPKGVCVWQQWTGCPEGILFPSGDSLHLLPRTPLDGILKSFFYTPSKVIIEGSDLPEEKWLSPHVICMLVKLVKWRARRAASTFAPSGCTDDKIHFLISIAEALQHYM